MTYSNEAKMALLGVSPQTLKEYGAVSFQVAAELAQGARKAFPIDLCSLYDWYRESRTDVRKSLWGRSL